MLRDGDGDGGLAGGMLKRGESSGAEISVKMNRVLWQRGGVGGGARKRGTYSMAAPVEGRLYPRMLALYAVAFGIYRHSWNSG